VARPGSYRIVGFPMLWEQQQGSNDVVTSRPGHSINGSPMLLASTCLSADDFLLSSRDGRLVCPPDMMESAR